MISVLATDDELAPDEIWDGNGDVDHISGGQEYAGATWTELARAVQADAMLFVGWDVRWVGNEYGSARQTDPPGTDCAASKTSTAPPRPAWGSARRHPGS